MQVFGKDDHGNIQIERNGIHYAVPDVLPVFTNPDTGERVNMYTDFVGALREEITAWVAEGNVVGTFQPFQPTIIPPMELPTPDQEI